MTLTSANSDQSTCIFLQYQFIRRLRYIAWNFCRLSAVWFSFRFIF